MQGKQVQMAFMDEGSTNNEKPAILVLHGKNFNGYYWREVIPFLVNAGYRVLVPDQVGWGRSDHPILQYGFHELAANTKQLTDSLGIKKLIVVGHSMGGMLATRFSLMYPDIVQKLVLENPIGLEDYKTFVPYQTFDQLHAKERSATYESYLAYQKSYYPVWQPEYEQYARAQAADLSQPNFDSIAKTNVLTYQMIYEQPVCYEFGNLRMPVLLIIGQEDRTIVGKGLLSEAMKKNHGQYQQLGKQTKRKIPRAKLVALPGVGHIPHIQSLPLFKEALLKFLDE